MKLTVADTPEKLRLIKTLYKQAFPIYERTPFALMRKKSKQGLIELLCITGDDDEFLGLVITGIYKDIVLLSYFAVCADKRGQRIGTTTLSLIRQRYPDKRLVLEIEDPEEPCQNKEERVRRKGFYQRNGLRVMPLRLAMFGVELLVMTDGERLTFDEYKDFYIHVFHPFFAHFIKRAD